MMYQKALSAEGDEFLLCVTGSVVSVFPADPKNTDYQQYLAWVAEGNEPEVIEL